MKLILQRLLNVATGRPLNQNGSMEPTATSVVGYVRVSSQEQASFGVSLDAQREKIIAYARLYELDLLAIIDDAPASAKTLKRPGIQSVMATLRRGEAQGLLIAKVDRLTRSLRDWQQLLDEFFGERAGRRGRLLFSVADSINTKTAMGRLSLNMSMAFSEFERDIIGERTRDALQFKIGKGERVGKVRFGYKLADDGKTLLPEPAEQRAIALMGALRAEGMTLRGIAEELTLAGFRTREGGPWSHKVIAALLNRSSAA